MEFKEVESAVTSDNVVVDFFMQLSTGRYNDRLEFQLEKPMSYRGTYPMEGKTIAETNEEIRNSLMLSMQYSYEEIVIIQSGGTVDPPTTIPTSVQNQLDTLLPSGQTTPYTEEQLSDAYKMAQEVIMTPPAVQQYSLTQSMNTSREQIVINLENSGSIKEMRAQAVLAATLASEGANVSVRVSESNNNPRDIFVRDPVAIVGDTVLIPTSFQEEQSALIAQLKEAGYTKFVNVDAEFCGGAVTTINVDGELKIIVAPMAGQSSESFANTVDALKNSTGLDVISISVPESVRDTYFHLDTFLSVLPNGEVLVYPGATTPETMEMLKNTVGEDRIITISEKDAASYATNIAATGNTLVTVGMSEELQTLLEEKGYKVITSEEAGLRPGELLMRRGGPHCLTQYPDPASFNASFVNVQSMAIPPALSSESLTQLTEISDSNYRAYTGISLPPLCGLEKIFGTVNVSRDTSYSPSSVPNMTAHSNNIQLS
jgi:N-dimethylarginine dimethylaminohydrolase